MAITLKDVASVAGVSTATVSRALAGSERVAPQTASHIRTIASDLGYRFDNVARALRQKRSNLVGLVVPDFAFPYAQDLLFALNQELFRAEFVLAAVTSFGSVDNEFVQVERLLGQRMDALLILPADSIKSAEAINIALDEEIPVIQLHRPVHDPRTSSFELDYASGIDFALRCLLQSPVTTVAYCDDGAGFAAESKREAFRTVVSRNRIDNYTIHSLDSGARPGDAPYAELSHHGKPPRLIVCGSYRIAEDISRFYGEQSDVAQRPIIVCLDAVPRENHSVEGNVISVEYPMYALARVLVERINRALDDEVSTPENARVQPFINLSRLQLARPLSGA